MKSRSVIFKILFCFSIICTTAGFSQTESKGYSKEIALYKAKFFISDVIGPTADYQKLIIDPLAASKSSEISSIYYESGNQIGLVLGFFDDFWGAEGSYKGYAFKNLNKESAILLLDKIELIVDVEKKFLNAHDDENNIFFSHEDITVMIYRNGPLSGRIRLNWDGYDGEWDNTAFRRTKSRFEKSLD
jgi:hypothetical protein